MNTKKTFAILILLLTLGACGDSSPESKLEDINTMLAKNFPLTEQQKSDVDKLVSEGKQALENGQKEQSSQAFADALKVLKLAEDAAMFNKSE